MAAEGGIFLDILARLNMASVDRVLTDVNTIMRDAGAKSGRAFSEGFKLDGAAAQFKELTAASDAAFRDMQRGLAELQVQEAKINDLRARNFKRSTDSMIAAQREFDAALANSQRLIEASSARAAEQRAGVAALPSRGGGSEDRGPRGGGGRSPVIPLPRGANIAGAGAAIGLAGGAYESGRIAVDVQGSLNRMQAQQHDSNANIQLLTQSVYQLAQQTGYKPKEIAGAYGNVERATNYQTGQGYRGQDAVDVMRNSLQFSRVTGTNLDESIQAITTTSHDYRIKLEDAAALLAAGSANIKGSMDDFASSLHSIEPIAQQAGIQPTEIIAALEQASQTGQTSQQSAPNLSNLIKNLAKPNSAQAKRMSQFGINPQDISTQLSQRGLAGTLQVVQQKILESMGPDGAAHLGFAMQNQLAQQQQQEDLEHLSPDAARLVQTPAFQKSEIGGFQVRSLVRDPKKLKELFGQSNIDLNDTDLPIVQDYLKKQQELHGPNSAIRSDSPDVQNVLGAYSAVAGGQDAGRMLMMLAGSPQLLDQFKGREADLGKQGTPNAFNDAFNQAMQSDKAKFEKLGAAAEALAGKMGEHMLPALGRFVDDLNDLVDWLDQHKEAEKALVHVLLTMAEAWGAAKIINSVDGIGTAFSKLKGSADKLATATETVSTQVEENTKGPGGLLGKVRGNTGLGMAGMLATGAGLPELPGTDNFPGGGMAKGALNSAAALSWLFGPEVGAPVTITVAAAEIIASQVSLINSTGPGVDIPSAVGYQQHWGEPGSEFFPGVLGSLGAPRAPKGGKNSWWSGADVPGPVPFGPAGAPNLAPMDTKARGGIVGFYGGGTADPYSQPLLGQPDMGGDSLLGMLPGGRPVGLRGGEGILTPEAVQAIGGKGAIDSLNSNPWSNPGKVGTKFFGSFAKGMAKSSPFGKYLVAASQSLDSLEKESEEATGMHEGGRGRKGLPQVIQQMLASGMSQEQVMQAIGAHPGKRGGFELPGGGYLSAKDKQELGLPASSGGSGGSGKASWFGNEETVHSVFSKYFSEDQWAAYRNLEMHEAGFNPEAHNPSGAFGIGQFMPYTWGQYGTSGLTHDLTTQAEDQMKYIKGRYGDPSAAWGQYFNHPGGEGSYARGGVVGYGLGGILPDAPPPPPPEPTPQPAIGTPSNGLAPVDQGPPVNHGATPPPPRPGQPPPPQHGQSGMPGGSTPKPTKPQPAHPDARKPPKAPSALTPQGVKPGDYAHSDDRNIHANTSRPMGTENQSKGFGIGGGIIGAAESGAAGMGGPFGAAAQPMFQLANRAIGYAGQLAGIGITGLMETFLPNDSKLGDPSNNIFGKMAFGIAGAHQSPKNSAGSSALQLKPKEDLDAGAASAKQVMPMVHMDHPTIHNHTGDHSETGDSILKAAFGLPVGRQP